MRTTLILAAIAALAFSTVAEAKSCKDAAGKFTKCPPAAAAPSKATQCKDAKGKFTKCPTTTAVATTTKTENFFTDVPVGGSVGGFAQPLLRCPGVGTIAASSGLPVKAIRTTVP